MDVRDTLLLVKSSADRRAMLRSVFEDNYNLLEAETGEQAMLLMEQNCSCIAAVLLNSKLPVMSGFDVLSAMQKNPELADIPVVIITTSPAEDEALAFDLGASDVVVDPYDPFVLSRRIQTLLDLNRHKWHLEELAAEQAKILQHSNDVMVDALSSIIEYRSVESGQHILRIRRFTQILLNEIAQNCPEYGLTDYTINIIASASALHDVGKISIPDSILNKPAALTEEEMELMRTHTLTGCRILESLSNMGNEEYLRYAHNICHYHHERWDGNGYPERLRGDKIPICAQVVGLADVYDALTSKRVYKDAYALDKATNMILNGECGIFSPKLLECFKRVIHQMAETARAYSDGHSPKSDHITAPLPGPTPQDGLTTLEMSQLKYQTLLHYIDSTAFEVDLDQATLHLLYNPDPNLIPLSSATSFQEAKAVLGERIIVPEEYDKLQTILSQGIPEFLNRGLRRHSFIFHVRPRIPGSPIPYEVTLLRPDIVNPSRRNMIVLFRQQPKNDQHNNGDTLFERGADYPGLVSLAGLFSYQNDRYLTLNQITPGFSGMLGYSAQDLTSLFHNRLIELIYPEDRAMVLRSSAEQLSKGSSFELEYRIFHKDGRILWVLNKSQRILGPDGAESLHGILLDITKTKNEEEDLRLSLEHHKILVAQTDNVTFEWNMITDRLACSDRWQSMFGHDPLGGDISSLTSYTSHIHPEDVPQVIQSFDMLRSGNATYQEVEARLVKSDGRYLWCRLRATALADTNGVPFKAVGIIINIDQEKRATQALMDKAERDALTKLLNKDTSRQYTEAYLASCRDDERAALLIIDMDNFKNINDQYGHMFGDAVLSLVSGELRKLFRNNDIVARIGGDEFFVLMKDIPNTTLVEDRCTKLLSAIKESLSQRLPGCKLGCSVGVSLFPEHGLSYQDLFQRADVALYQAKRLGKNGFQCYSVSQSFPTLQKSESIIGTRIDSDMQPGMADDSIVHYAFRRLYESGDVIETINAVLELIGQQMNVSRVYVFENTPDNKFCNNTFEWCNEGIAPEIDNLQNISYETDIPDYEKNFDERGIFYCPDIAQLPKNLYEILAPQNVKSLLHCAIRENGAFRGYVGFDECSTLRYWTQEQIDTLTFFSEIISIFLLKQRTQDDIQRRTEDLTSVLDNQNAWIYVIDPDTCKLRFLNAKTRELAPDAQEGMPCYQSLMGQKKRCAGCPALNIQKHITKSRKIDNNHLNVSVLAEATHITWGGESACLMTCRKLTKKNT